MCKFTDGIRLQYVKLLTITMIAFDYIRSRMSIVQMTLDQSEWLDFAKNFEWLYCTGTGILDQSSLWAKAICGHETEGL